jgi:hypothetical protein
MLVRVDDLDAGVAVLRRIGLAAERRKEDLRVAISCARAAQVTETLAQNGQWVTDLRPDERSLEELFLELTGAGEPAGAWMPQEVGA